MWGGGGGGSTAMVSCGGFLINFFFTKEVKGKLVAVVFDS